MVKSDILHGLFQMRSKEKGDRGSHCDGGGSEGGWHSMDLLSHTVKHMK